MCDICGGGFWQSEANIYKSDGNININLNSNYWMSERGVKSEFKDMSKEYLKNTIKLLKRSYSRDELIDSPLFRGLTQEYFLKD